MGEVSAIHTDSVNFCYVFCNSQKRRHTTERLPQVITQNRELKDTLASLRISQQQDQLVLAEQKKQLTAEFRSLLVRTYSGALSAYRPDTLIRYKPTRDLGDGEKLVRSEVVQAGNEPIGLDYYMAKSDKGWVIFDITVFGARLVENYRSTFKSEVNNVGIDGLVKSLAAMNKAADAKKG